MVERPPQDRSQLTQRPMRVEDADTLADAEMQCFPEDPWSRQAFLDLLSLSAFHGVVLERKGRFIGYLVAYEVLDEGELLNIAVLPEFRGQGYGRYLLEEWLHRLESQGGRLAFLDVRAGNHSAISLYESCGFRVTGKRRAYYGDGEDALEMTRVRTSETSDFA